ncbi:HAD-IA family hydrolase [Patescibacteria group bacterium]|nr:HAD-IA family hydrolase [Patescibacteria group bacterium]
MIKAILFDIDGVLSASGPRFFGKALEKDHGISNEKAITFFHGVFRKVLKGELDLKTEIGPYLKDWGWRGTVQDFLDYWFKSEHKSSEKLIKFIQKLRKQGILCCLATNQENYRAKYILKEMGFEKAFDKYYFSAHIGHKKPEIKFFEKVFKDLKIFRKDEILFWDDLGRNIIAAREFGFIAEQYTTFEDSKKKMKKYLA